MKTIEFKVVELGEENPYLRLSMSDILSAPEGQIRKFCEDYKESAKGMEYNYREVITDHLRSNLWSQGHPLKNSKDIMEAIRIEEVLESKGDKVEADDNIINLICDVALDMQHRNASLKVLKAIHAFKLYFEGLKKEEGKTVNKKK